jgi:hypothetical protein
MECSRCGSHNVKTFEMAYASYNVGISSWDTLVKLLLLGPLGLLIKPRRNSIADITAPPEKPFPILSLVLCFVFFSTLVWLVSIYRRRGLSYPETQDALIVNAVLLVITLVVVSWDVIRFVKARKAYPERLDKWVHSWICLQCGMRYEVREQLT